MDVKCIKCKVSNTRRISVDTCTNITIIPATQRGYCVGSKSIVDTAAVVSGVDKVDGIFSKRDFDNS